MWKQEHENLNQEELINKEERYLHEVLAFLEQRENYLQENNQRITDYSKELKEMAWEEHLELADANTNGAFDSAMVQNELAQNHKQILDQVRELRLIPRLKKKAFFGHIRFRFYEDDHLSEPEDMYIGLSDVIDVENFRQYVIDWRAPVATLYYNVNDLGPASYRNMQQVISGELVAKYQVEVDQARVIRVINTTQQIYDEILQMVLSTVSSARMKEIVQTLQKEQNVIVRAEPNRNLIIQGVAGSGKTSIALHRAAYLMYIDVHLTADNILLITPSESFANYISSVLPNLGEENVRHMTAQQILINELSDLEGRYFHYQYNVASQEKKNAFAKFDWVDWAKEFSSFLTANVFQAKDIENENLKVPARLLQQLYSTNYRHLPAFARQRAMLLHLKDLIHNRNDYQEAYEQLDNSIRSMYLFFSIRSCFEVFVRWVTEEKGIQADLFSMDLFDTVDLGLLALLKVLLFGSSEQRWVRHLIIDEMQDLNAVEHECFRLIFHCPKTLLGDINQAVAFPLESDYLFSLRKLYQEDTIRTEHFELKKSYRSTKQITEFTRKILQEDSIQALHREGSEVKIRGFGEEEQSLALEELYKILKDWQTNGYRNTAVIVNDADDIRVIESFLRMRQEEDDTFVINHFLQEEEQFAVTLCSIEESKGVEFDSVLVWDVSKEHYSTELDRTKLYVACTRALHDLSIFYIGEVSDILPMK